MGHMNGAVFISPLMARHLRRHASRGSLAGLIARDSPEVQECNYLLTQIILLAASQCLCSGRATPGTQPSADLRLNPPCSLTSRQAKIIVCVCVCTKLKSDGVFSFLLGAYLRYLCIMVVIKSSYLLVSPPGPLFRNGQTLNYSNPPSMLIYLMLDA